MMELKNIYFMPDVGPEKGAEAEKSGAEAAKAKLGEFFPKAAEMKDGDDKGSKGKQEKDQPKVEQENFSPDKEGKRTDESARADVIAIMKQGKKFDNTLPGLDAATVKQVKEGLSKLPAGENMATKRMQVEVTVQEAGKEVTKTLYLVSIADTTKNTVSMYYKVDDDFSPNSRTFIKDLDDDKMLDLVGGGSEAAKGRLEAKTQAVVEAKATYEKINSKGDSADKKDKAEAAMKLKQAEDDLKEYDKKYQVALKTKPSGSKAA